tara:strand:+ start:1065 stop:2357 length:1293 start_codon:yes stop_codon:yes gene_type:complete
VIILENNFTTYKSCALKLDQNDKISKYRNIFYKPNTNTFEPFIYFCGNSLGLQPNTVSTYINDELDAWKEYGVYGHTKSKRPWMSYHENFIKYSAELIGAKNKEVVVMNSLTVNLHLLMTSFYRPKNKKIKILIENNAFPSDKYAVQSQLKFHKNHPSNDLLILKPKEGDLISTEYINDFFKHHGDNLALVLIGGVNYYTGQAFDIHKITKIAHEYGCIVGFDLAHAAGNIELNLHDWGVDFAAWCGYKYLNGGPGAPSGVFIHERHLGIVDIPRFEGWWGHDKNTRFNMPNNFNPIKTAEAWQLSNPPIFSMAPLLASLEIFNNVGMPDLRKKSKLLTNYLYFLIIEKLESHIEIITPKTELDRGCQLSLRMITPIENIIDELHKNGIIADWREPDVIRIAPVPLYNSFMDCFEFVERFIKIINSNILK